MADLCLVGYTYRGYEMAYAFERARDFGYRSIELRDFSDIDLSKPHGVELALKKAIPLAERHGLSIYSLFYAALPVSRKKESFAQEKSFCEVLPILAELGVPILHTRLSLASVDGSDEVESAHAREEDYAAVQETLQRVAPQAEQYGVRIALEAHMGTIHDTASSLRRIVSDCGSPFLAACLDFANLLIARREENLIDAIHAFTGFIGYTHIKNVKLFPWGYDWNLPVRLGDINYSRILHALKTAGYGGPLAVEYCGSGDPDVFAEEDASYLAGLAERVGL
jgi:sugar phosphate isomerase/epimerase